MSDFPPWMEDNESDKCLVCQTPFSISNRKHHCRRCGRLVCDSCSRRRRVLTAGSAPPPGSTAADKTDMSAPQRVCDDCWAGFQKRDEIQATLKLQREKEMALLQASSRVSDTLVRIYLLDGSYKTLSFEPETRAGDMAIKLCLPVQVALFEVDRDIKDPEQYRLIPNDDTICTVLSRWEVQEKTSAKLLLPVRSVHDFHAGRGSRRAARRALQQIGELTGGGGGGGGAGGDLRDSTMNGADGGASGGLADGGSGGGGSGGGGGMGGAGGALSRLAGGGAGGGGNGDRSAAAHLAGASTVSMVPQKAELQRLQQELQTTRVELAEIKQKYDVLRSVHRKNKQPRQQEWRRRKEEARQLREQQFVIRESSAGMFPMPVPRADELQAGAESGDGGSFDSLTEQENGEDALDDGQPNSSAGTGGAQPLAVPSGNSTGGDVKKPGKKRGVTSRLSSSWSSIAGGLRLTASASSSGGNAHDPQFAGASAATTTTATTATTTSTTGADREGQVPPGSPARDPAYGGAEDSCTVSADSPTRSAGVATEITGPQDAMTLSKSCLLCGWLQKLGSYHKRFQNRFFVLCENGALFYYKTNDSARAQGHFDMRGLLKARRGADKNTMILIVPGRRIVLAARSQTEMQEWFQRFEHFIAVRKGTAAAEPENLKEVTTYFETLGGGLDTDARHVKSFMDKLSEIEEFFAVVDDNIRTTFQQGVDGPDKILHAYEMINAMQSVYDDVLGYGEDWISDLQDWLVRSLRMYMQLPVERPEMLMAVISCLSHENMLNSPQVIEVVQQVIEISFEDTGNDAADGAETDLAAVLGTVKRMVSTLHMVVDDLLPLLPDQFNVISMFQTMAEARIQSRISNYFYSHRDMDIRDVLTLLSWADNHKTVMERFGVTRFSEDFQKIEQELVRNYKTQVGNMMAEWIGRIHREDSRAEVQSVDGVQITNWPEDLVNSLTQQFDLATQELQGEAAGDVIKHVLTALSRFHDLHKQWLDTYDVNMELARLAAVANNYMRFCEKLEDMERSVCDEVDTEIEERVHDAFQETITLFTGGGQEAVDKIVDSVALDIVQGMQESLFTQDWFNGPVTMRLMRGALQDYTSDLRQWLANDFHLFHVLLGILKRVSKTYVQSFLRSRQRITHDVKRRLNEDFEHFSETFRAYDGVLREDMVSRQLLPMQCIVTLTVVDHRPQEMVGLVRTQVYPAFGKNTLLIWERVMGMRDMEKQTLQELKRQILDGWSPQELQPVMTIELVDKRKSKLRR